MTTASIVTYNTKRSDLDKILASALADGVDTLYVVDHSPEETASDIEAMLPADPRIVYERHPNRGYGAGHNIAIRKAIEAGADYHAVLNPDVYWEGRVIERLAEYMENHPDVGQMLPKVLYPDGTLQYTCKLIPTPYDLIASRFLPDALKRRRMARFRLESTGYRHIMNVPYMHGCFMMLRVAALRDVGLFDERFFMYPEDIDLTRRIHERWKTLFYPPLTIYHAHARESRVSSRMLRIHVVNMIRYFNKWGWLFDTRRRRYNRILEAEIAHDGFGGLPSSAHGQDDGGRTGDDVTSGEDTRS